VDFAERAEWFDEICASAQHVTMNCDLACCAQHCATTSGCDFFDWFSDNGCRTNRNSEGCDSRIAGYANLDQYIYERQSAESCTSATSSGMMTLSVGGTSITTYCYITGNEAYAKLVGTDSEYVPTASAIGTMKAANTDDHKLSDSDINALRAISKKDGSDNIYRFKARDTSRYSWLKSSQTYTDTLSSFNLNTASYKARNDQSDGDQYEGVVTWSHQFTQSWIDYLYGGEGGETHDRMFVGHGRFDCYSPQESGTRCFASGSQHGYAPLAQAEVYLYMGIVGQGTY